MANLLVIEDDPQLRKVFRAMLEMFEHETVSAANGQEGLDLLDEAGNTIDLIFMDWNMFDMTGDVFLQAIEDDGRWVDIPTVVMTGTMMRDLMVAYQRYNVKGFLNKPFRMEQLEKLLHQFFPISA